MKQEVGAVKPDSVHYLFKSNNVASETNSLIKREEELDRIIDNLLGRLQEILSISKWLEEEYE